MAVLEDDDDIIRQCHSRLAVTTWLTHLVAVWTLFSQVLYDCSSACSGVRAKYVSESVKSMWESGTYEKWIE